MRLLRRSIPFLLCVLAAFAARPHSRGAALGSVVSGYLSALDSSDGETAAGLLTDSLASRVSPSFIVDLAGAPSSDRMLVGRSEPRGLAVSLSLDSGGSRMLWLRQDPEDEWRVSGDTSLDNLLGAASMACLSFAMDSVVLQAASGHDTSGLVCPVTGENYFSANGLLLCPGGHLGDGLDLHGSACAASRQELVLELEVYMAEGHTHPASFREMFDLSEGAYSRSGGYRCPDYGYSYYRITSEGVYCPYHDSTSPLAVSDLSDTEEETSR